MGHSWQYCQRYGSPHTPIHNTTTSPSSRRPTWMLWTANSLACYTPGMAFNPSIFRPGVKRWAGLEERNLLGPLLGMAAEVALFLTHGREGIETSIGRRLWRAP